MLKVCLTGGPCAGKSTVLSALVAALEPRGYKVLIVPETATELILNGIAPGENISLDKFQEFVLDKQLFKEKLYLDAVDFYGDKTVIICDRGIMDQLAYINKDKFEVLMKERGMSFNDGFAWYDCVLHLVTAADGAEEFYQWNDPNKPDSGNNAARRESPEEARHLDKKTLNSWVGHPHLKVIDNSTNFSDKVNRVIDYVFSMLGEPERKKVQKKFLVKKPSKSRINSMGHVAHMTIMQTYLNSPENIERRIRQIGNDNGGYNFYYSETKNLENNERLITERKISPREYHNLLIDMDTSLHSIKKSRYCFVNNNSYFNLDIFPFSSEYALLEVEDDVNIDFFEVIKEVTDDINFRNYELAKTMVFNVNAEDIPKTCAIEPVWFYETGRDETEILGSGSRTYNVVTTKDESEAFELVKKCSRNYLKRKCKMNGMIISQWYDFYSKEWLE